MGQLRRRAACLYRGQDAGAHAHHEGVAAILVSRYDRYDEVYPKQKTIAEQAGIGIKAVGLALAHLENRGLIIRTRTHDREGRRSVDLCDLAPLVAAINRLVLLR